MLADMDIIIRVLGAQTWDKYMLPAHDKRAYLTNNEYISYTLSSWAGNMYTS